MVETTWKGARWFKRTMADPEEVSVEAAIASVTVYRNWRGLKDEQKMALKGFHRLTKGSSNWLPSILWQTVPNDGFPDGSGRRYLLIQRTPPFSSRVRDLYGD